MSEYLVIYEQGETSWGAYCPDLPGLGVVGKTHAEVERLIREGVEIHIESLRESDEPVPEPTSMAGLVAVCDGVDTHLLAAKALLDWPPSQ